MAGGGGRFAQQPVGVHSNVAPVGHPLPRVVLSVMRAPGRQEQRAGVEGIALGRPFPACRSPPGTGRSPCSCDNAAYPADRAGTTGYPSAQGWRNHYPPDNCGTRCSPGPPSGADSRFQRFSSRIITFPGHRRLSAEVRSGAGWKHTRTMRPASAPVPMA